MQAIDMYEARTKMLHLDGPSTGRFPLLILYAQIIYISHPSLPYRKPTCRLSPLYSKPFNPTAKATSSPQPRYPHSQSSTPTRPPRRTWPLHPPSPSCLACPSCLLPPHVLRSAPPRNRPPHPHADLHLHSPALSGPTRGACTSARVCPCRRRSCPCL